MRKGQKTSEETRRKLSEINKGKGGSFETLQKMWVRNKGNSYGVGRQNTPEHRRRISETHKGKPKTAEHRRKISEAKMGHAVTEEQRQKQRAAMTGRKLTPEHRRKLSNRLMGNKRTLGYKHSTSFLQKLSERTKGDKNPRWRGGISFEPYSTQWTRQLKHRIRIRDSYICQVCSLPQGKSTHPVHHIDYDKKNCLETNLITLCSRCHSKANSRREYWQRYFQAFMATREGKGNAIVETQCKLQW